MYPTAYKIAKNSNRLSRVQWGCTNVTDRRQTTDGRTSARRYIAPTMYRDRSLCTQYKPVMQTNSLVKSQKITVQQ